MIQRYDCAKNDCPGLKKCMDGDFVDYDDHVEAVKQELKNARKNMAEQAIDIFFTAWANREISEDGWKEKIANRVRQAAEKE